jgi:hypothetical protein
MKIQEILRGSKRELNEVAEALNTTFEYPRKGQETFVTFAKADRRSDLIIRNEGKLFYSLFKIIEA